MTNLYDPIRLKYVPDLPEERVRQALLHQMTQALGYPRALIGVEKRVGKRKRRADILVYFCVGSELKPLLIIECKAESVDEAGYWQASGYNAEMAAPFLCVAHAEGIRTFWQSMDGVQSVNFLPPYPQLISRVQYV